MAKASGTKVPFIGWSKAADDFRMIADRRARTGAGSVLIIAGSASEREAMARVWQTTARADDKELPIIDLDSPNRSEVPPRCIAITGRPTPAKPRAVQPIHLGSMPKPACKAIQSEDRQGALPAALAGRFALKVYMPPLKHRPIDVLAWLHYCNSTVLPAFGFQYEAISATLVHQMLLDSPWPGDVDALFDFMRTSADVERVAGKITTLPLLDGDELLPHFLPDFDFKQRTSPNPVRVYWDGAIPFRHLPDLAVRIFRWRAQFDFGESHEIDDGDAIPLGIDVGGSHLSAWDAEWTAEQFQQMPLDRFVSDWALQGLPANEQQRRELIHRLQSHPILGTTFSALNAGLSVPLDRAPVVESLQARARRTKRRRASRRQESEPLKLTDRERTVWTLCHEERKPVKEVAVKLKCSDKNVYSLLAKAEKKVKAMAATGRSARARAGLPTWELAADEEGSN